MVIAYQISAADGGCFFFQDAPDELFCKKCKSFIGTEPYFPERLRIKKKRDFLYSYENRLIISLAAKEFLEAHTKGVIFHQVNGKPPYFFPVVERIVNFDAKRTGTRFAGPCGECGNWESVTISTPQYLVPGTVVDPMGIYRTDLEFASGWEKTPLTVVGTDLGKMLKSQFNEIDLHEIKE